MTNPRQATAKAFLHHYLAPYKINIVIATLCSLLLGAVSAAVFALIGPAMRVIMAPDKTQVLPLEQLFGAQISSGLTLIGVPDSFTVGVLWQLIPVVLLTLAAGRAVTQMASWYIWEKLGERLAMQLRLDLYQRFLGLDPRLRSAESHQVEERFASILTNDVRLVREFVIHYYGGFPREALQTIFYILTLLVLSYKLFGLFVLILLPASIPLGKLGKKLKKRAKAALDDFATLSEWLQQRLLGIETIKHYRTEELEIQRMQTISTQLFRQLVKVARVKARTSPLVEVVAVGAMVVVLGFSLYATMSGQATGSVQLSFFSTLAVLAQSTTKLSRYYNTNKEGLTAVERIFDSITFMDQHVLPESNHVETQAMDAALRVQNLTVHYEGKPTPALDQVSFDFHAGKIYGIYGPSGSGKSTLFLSVLGVVNFVGKIAIHSRLPQRWLGYLPQQVRLAPGSIAENIAYPSESFDEAKVWESLRAVHMEKFVRELPLGLATTVGPEGIALSGGQAQRLGLARLIYQQFPVVLIDEGTSALDPEIEQVVLKVLKSMAAAGACVIMIAHRPSTQSYVDERMMLREGKLAMT